MRKILLVSRWHLFTEMVFYVLIHTIWGQGNGSVDEAFAMKIWGLEFGSTEPMLIYIYMHGVSLVTPALWRKPEILWTRCLASWAESFSPVRLCVYPASVSKVDSYLGGHPRSNWLPHPRVYTPPYLQPPHTCTHSHTNPHIWILAHHTYKHMYL